MDIPSPRADRVGFLITSEPLPQHRCSRHLKAWATRADFVVPQNPHPRPAAAGTPKRGRSARRTPRRRRSGCALCCRRSASARARPSPSRVCPFRRAGLAARPLRTCAHAAPPACLPGLVRMSRLPDLGVCAYTSYDLKRRGLLPPVAAKCCDTCPLVANQGYVMSLSVTLAICCCSPVLWLQPAGLSALLEAAGCMVLCRRFPWVRGSF